MTDIDFDFDEFIHTSPDGRIMEIEVMITKNTIQLDCKEDKKE